MHKRTYDHNGHTDLEISCPDLSDEQVANRVRMLMRGDLDHELVCQAARDRIKCLMKEKAELESQLTWRPIETIPKDGTEVLCRHVGKDGVVRVNISRWHEGQLYGPGWTYWPSDLPKFWMPLSARFPE
jgi:hypothetical protein